MYREIIKPTKQSHTILIPEELLNQEVEILVLPFSRKTVVSDYKSDTVAFSNHSANLIHEWKDNGEDAVWK